MALDQIANLVTVQGEDRPMVKNVMTLKSCSSIVGVDVMSFDSEKDVLLAWRVCTQDNTAQMFHSLIFCAIGFSVKCVFVSGDTVFPKIPFLL